MWGEGSLKKSTWFLAQTHEQEFTWKKTPDKGKNTGKGMKSRTDSRCVGSGGRSPVWMWHMAQERRAESDTGASCSLNYHLGTNCQKETYWRKISTIMKKLEIAHESEHKTLWITWKIKHLKIYWYKHEGHYIYFPMLEVTLGRQYF